MSEVSSIRSRAEDVQADVRTLGKDVGRLAGAMRDQAQVKLEQGREAARELSAEGAERAKEVADTARAQFQTGLSYTEDKVRQHPMAALGIAAGVGLVLGMIFSPRR